MNFSREQPTVVPGSNYIEESTKMQTHTKSHPSSLILGIIACLSASSPALAQLSVERSVIAGGGGESVGGTFDLIGTVGQAAAGPSSGPMTGGTFSVLGGFWSGQPALCPSDFDNNGFVNGDDFDQFVALFIEGDPGADFDHNGFVNGDDFDQFVTAFESGC